MRKGGIGERESACSWFGIQKSEIHKLAHAHAHTHNKWWKCTFSSLLRGLPFSVYLQQMVRSAAVCARRVFFYRLNEFLHTVFIQFAHRNHAQCYVGSTFQKAVVRLSAICIYSFKSDGMKRPELREKMLNLISASQLKLDESMAGQCWTWFQLQVTRMNGSEKRKKTRNPFWISMKKLFVLSAMLTSNGCSVIL